MTGHGIFLGQAPSPREMYSRLERFQVEDEWFEVYQLPHRVLALYEPGHYQEVISYLILGQEKNLLLDTGMGLGNIRQLVEKIAPGDLIVVNSHFHFDHVGGNHQFGRVHLFDDEFAVRRLERGFSADEVRPEFENGQLWKWPPAGVDVENFSIPPTRVAPIKNGHRFDLGDRTLEVIHAPGHSPDSIVLFDAESRILFTGDVFYPGPLFANFGDDYYGYSDFQTYATTMARLANLAGDLEHLYTAHIEPLADPSILTEVAAAFQEVQAGRAKGDKDEAGFTRYPFKGFSIIAG